LYKATFSSLQPDTEASGTFHTMGKELLVPTKYWAGRAPKPF